MRKWDLMAIWAWVSPDEIRFECHFLISTLGPEQITDQRSEVTGNTDSLRRWWRRESRQEDMWWSCKWREDWFKVRLWLSVEKVQRISGDVAAMESWSPDPFFNWPFSSSLCCIMHLWIRFFHQYFLCKRSTEEFHTSHFCTCKLNWLFEHVCQ